MKNKKKAKNYINKAKYYIKAKDDNYKIHSLMIEVGELQLYEDYIFHKRMLDFPNLKD